MPDEPHPPADPGRDASAAEDPGEEARHQLIRWRPSYRVTLGLAYGSLFAIIVVGICLVALLPHVGAVQQYGPNVVATFVGLLITLTFVERLLTWQRTRQEAPLRSVALHRAWLRLNRLTHMLLFSYKAAAIEGSPAPTDLEALMAAWRIEARHLDFRKSAGAQQGNRPWYDYLSETAVDFETELYQIIDRYLVVLGSDFPAAVESVIGDTVFEGMKIARVVSAYNASSGIDRPINLFVVQSIEDPNRDSLAEFADRIITMERAYRSLGGKPLTLSAPMYRNDVSPEWGSGRIDGAKLPIETAGSG